MKNITLVQREIEKPVSTGIICYVGGTTAHTGFVLDKQWTISRIDTHTGHVTKIIDLPQDERSDDYLYQLVPGIQDRYLAFTYQHTDRRDMNRGYVLNTETCEVILNLDTQDSLGGLTNFPVNFFTLDGKDLIVHGTDWNRLDISDLATGEILTNRNLDETPEEKEEWSCFSERNGHIVVSPDQTRAACVGWVWHPIGVAHTWRLDNWLRSNPFEVDVSEEKVSQAAWDYDWGATIRWVGNQRLAIWSGDEFLIDAKNPHVLIVDVTNSDQRLRIEGPENNFYTDGEVLIAARSSGVGLWSAEDGDLLAMHPGTLVGYNSCDREWLTIDDDKWTYWRYSDASINV